MELRGQSLVKGRKAPLSVPKPDDEIQPMLKGCDADIHIAVAVHISPDNLVGKESKGRFFVPNGAALAIQS